MIKISCVALAHGPTILLTAKRPEEFPAFLPQWRASPQAPEGARHLRRHLGTGEGKPSSAETHLARARAVFNLAVVEDSEVTGIMEKPQSVTGTNSDLQADRPPQAVGAEESKPRRPRGFAAMDRKLVSEIARKGGKAAHSAGTAHEFTSEEAREAGRKGGHASHANRRKLIADKPELPAETEKPQTD
jgi:general stress protein YciG